jgi:hypothetical protein
MHESWGGKPAFSMICLGGAFRLSNGSLRQHYLEWWDAIWI